MQLSEYHVTDCGAENGRAHPGSNGVQGLRIMLAYPISLDHRTSPGLNLDGSLIRSPAYCLQCLPFPHVAIVRLLRGGCSLHDC